MVCNCKQYRDQDQPAHQTAGATGLARQEEEGKVREIAHEVTACMHSPSLCFWKVLQEELGQRATGWEKDGIQNQEGTKGDLWLRQAMLERESKVKLSPWCSG